MGYRVNDVRPRKWTRVIDLYDDGFYSAIWGSYDNWKSNAPRCIGVRYNGDINEKRDHGYPNQGGNPLWYVEPDFLTLEILQKLKKMVESELGKTHEYYANIETAIKEFTEES